MICPKCSEEFIRVQPAQVYCSNCGLTKPTQENLQIDMSSESDSNEDDGNLSVEITDLKHVIKVKDEEIQKLTEEVLKLQLIIADKFIDTQSTYDLPRPTEQPTRNGSYANVVKKPAPY